MKKDKLITKQQLQIEEYKTLLEENNKLKKQLRGMFYNIGRPLNDNILQFNKEQMKWCFDVVQLVDEINILPLDDDDE